MGHDNYPDTGDLAVTQANHVWCTDITYRPKAHDSVYLAAIVDWHTRPVLSWRQSTTEDAWFCLEVLKETIERHGCPQIFNTDQGSEFISSESTDALASRRTQIPMDDRGNLVDNVVIERRWRSPKYERVRLSAFDTISDADDGINHWMTHYNQEGPHSSLNDRTPAEAYQGLAA